MVTGLYSVDVETNGFAAVEWVDMMVEAEQLSCDVVKCSVIWAWEVLEKLLQNMEPLSEKEQSMKWQLFLLHIWHSRILSTLISCPK